jgi:hypothetical protein
MIERLIDNSLEGGDVDGIGGSLIKGTISAFV